LQKKLALSIILADNPQKNLGADRMQMARKVFGRGSLPTGFTLVEMLVTMAVIAILIALLLPAVQAARAAARRTECRNRLKQIALAFHHHEETFGRLPSNGWGFQWVGDPNRGTDRSQPGGWAYNVLPFLEHSALRKRGLGESGAALSTTLSDIRQTVVSTFQCPERSSGSLSPANQFFPPFNAIPTANVAKIDYAVNEGDYITNTGTGPPTLAIGDSPAYVWLDVSQATGVCFQRSELRWADIKDGLSATYLVGEKYVMATAYQSAADPGYDQSWNSGVDLDMNRWTIDPPRQDASTQYERRFGSAHAGGCHMALCDGSVRFVNYSIDAATHRALGHRRDGKGGTPP
jgi:prepilin-type N-terminal cleavage/methylation domain-containing protein/prepilin-type processing-associated H-X9-DG protein